MLHPEVRLSVPAFTSDTMTARMTPLNFVFMLAGKLAVWEFPIPPR